MDAYLAAEERSALVGDFVEWATQKYPHATALEICYASQGADPLHRPPLSTHDPYLPTPGLLLLISKLLQAREAVSIYADSAYRWLPSTVKKLCPAAKVYAPCKRGQTEDFWQDSLFDGTYRKIDNLDELTLDAVAIIEYEEFHDRCPTWVWSMDGSNCLPLYRDIDEVLQIADRITDSGILIWVDCQFDLDHPFVSGLNPLPVTELRSRLKTELGLHVTAAFESNILSGKYDRPVASLQSAMVYVFEKSNCEIIPAVYDARTQISWWEEDRDTSTAIDDAILDFRRGFTKYRFTEDICLGTKALELKRQIKRFAADAGFKLVPWLDIFHRHDSKVSDNPDSESIVTIRLPHASWGVDFYARDRAQRQYLQQFFQSKLGDSFIKSCSRGREHLFAYDEYLEQSKIPVPPQAVQDEIVRVASIIDDIENEIRDCRSQLWTGDLAKVKRIGNQVNLLRKGDATQLWAQTLCLPLGSILLRYSTDHVAASEKKFERLLCFFESLTAWLATVSLTVAKGQSDVWQAIVSKLVAQEGHFSFHELTFGRWRTILETSISQAATTQDTPSNATQALKEVRPVLARANQLRNEWSGHDGHERNNEISEARHQELSRLLIEAHKLLGHALQNYRLVTPGEGEQTDEGYSCKFTELSGASSPFPTFRHLISGDLPVRGRYYLLETETSKLFELLPLIIFPNHQAKAYFYSRETEGGYKFVSHHNPSAPSITLQREEVPQFVKFLNSIRGQQ